MRQEGLRAAVAVGLVVKGTYIFGRTCSDEKVFYGKVVALIRLYISYSQIFLISLLVAVLLGSGSSQGTATYFYPKLCLAKPAGNSARLAF